MTKISKSSGYRCLPNQVPSGEVGTKALFLGTPGRIALSFRNEQVEVPTVDE